jgi:hypothetical protein
MATVLAMGVGFICGVFVTVIVLMLIEDNGDDK